MHFFLSSNRANSTLEMHHMDTSYIEKILEVTSDKTATVRPPTSHL